MSLFDGLVALGVLAAFAWMIISGLAEKNPKISEFIQSLSPLIEPPEKIDMSETSQQIWQEKRSMI